MERANQSCRKHHDSLRKEKRSWSFHFCATVAREAQHKCKHTTQTQGLVHRPQARSGELLEVILGRPYFKVHTLLPLAKPKCIMGYLVRITHV